MSHSIQNLLAEGYRFHTQGYFDAALILYEEALGVSPDSFEVLRLLGVLNLQMTHYRAASDFFQKALKQKPRNTEVLIHLGCAQAEAGDNVLAKASFEKALKIEPTNSGAAANLGLVMVVLGDCLAAEKFLKRAVLLDPSYFDAWLNLGNVLHQTGVHAKALESYRKATILRPTDMRPILGETATLIKMSLYQQAVAVAEQALKNAPEVAELIENKALALRGLGDMVGALSALQQAQYLKPESSSILSNLGSLCNDMGRYDEAIQFCSRAVHLDPALADAHNNLGLAYVSAGNYEDAIEAYHASIRLKPRFSEAYSNLGIVLAYVGRADEALESVSQALSLDTENACASMTKSVILLSQGCYKEGWKLYGSRFEARGEPKLLETWDGMPFEGVLIVTPEQGVGDQILFASMFSELARLQKQIIVKTDPRLISLFSRSFSGISFVSKDQQLHRDVRDRIVAMGSLGKYFRASRDDFPRLHLGYLSADPLLVSEIRGRLQEDRIKVGISWRSSEKKYGERKSLPLKDWLPILSLPDIEFIDLQYGETEAERVALEKASDISITKLPDIDNMQDLDRFAALVKSCDVVVTTSNSTAHFAGALGVPTIVMVPNGGGRLWYWNNLSSSVWYPAIRVKNLPIDGDWSTVMVELQKMLKFARGTC